MPQTSTLSVGSFLVLCILANAVTTVAYPINSSFTSSDIVSRAPGIKFAKTTWFDPSPTDKPAPDAQTCGSYAIMTPQSDFLIWDHKYKAYAVYFKFGDAIKDERHKDYSTHNPSLVFKHRCDPGPRYGKYMEKAVLKKLVEVFEKGEIQHVGTTSQTTIEKNSEWYEIYLGPDYVEALHCKEQIREMISHYGDPEPGEPVSESRKPYGDYDTVEEYIRAFLGLFVAKIDKSTPRPATRSSAQACQSAVVSKPGLNPQWITEIGGNDKLLVKDRLYKKKGADQKK
ncbi:hypothetical protein H0H92_007799 [Tricholoma furcatifolium]|nr:hypothetical protein H0H92_007799 [Tricholoma furcatifolium]